MTKALLFDVDGTLVDSNDLHVQAWVDTFEHYGHDLGFDAVRNQIGKGGDTLLPALLDRTIVEADGEAMSTMCTQIFKADYSDRVVAFPAVRPLLERAVADGWTIVLASSGQPEEVEASLALIGCEDLISGVTTTEDAETSKPAPDIFAAALKKSGVAASQAIVVGDTPYDVEAARKLDVRVVGLRCGGFPDDVLLAAGAAELYDDPADLLEHYATSILAT
ncbi:HAD family hydrolase [Aureimonas leprariae]|uniref:HAD family hydrolase n=1 Tax=Plantimonas leprariae TaxID=2615207 RepID=A0A7V7PSP7_9HYPH|nr:HAD family hydrolase [Aureimonas leprariae]